MLAENKKSENFLQKWNSFLKRRSCDQAVTRFDSHYGSYRTGKTSPKFGSVSRHVLEQFATVFAGSHVNLEDFLALLHSGMSLSQYRTIPATVDTVLVQSYDLIAPLTADFVYAIGLTQDNLPKIAQNTSLLTDEERQNLNQTTDEGAQFADCQQ